MSKDQALYRNDYPLLSRSKPLSPKAATLEALVISKIKPDATGKPSQVLLDKNTLSKYGICDVENDHFMRDLEILKSQLITYEIDLPPHPDFKARWRTLISQFDVFETGEVRIGVDPDLAPYLIGLRKYFSICDVVEVATLSNQYAKKLYMLLKTLEYEGHGRIPFSELKDSLGITNVKSYQTFKVFNARIFKSSLKEINDQSDILVEWSLVRANRRIVAVDFKIKKNPKHHPKLPIVEEITDEIPHEIRVFLDVYGFNNDSFIEDLLEQHGSELLLNAIKLFDKRNSHTSITNKGGLFHSKIGWYIKLIKDKTKRDKELQAAKLDEETRIQIIKKEQQKREEELLAYVQANKESLYNQLDDWLKKDWSLTDCPDALLMGLADKEVQENNKG